MNTSRMYNFKRYVIIKRKYAHDEEEFTKLEVFWASFSLTLHAVS